MGHRPTREARLPRAGRPALRPARRQLFDMRHRPRPLAEAGRRIQVSDAAEIHQPAAPGPREFARALQPRQRVVLAGHDDGRERQRPARQRQPAAIAQRVQRRIAGGQWRLEVGRRRQQGAEYRSRAVRRPMRRHDRAGAVRDDDHGAVDQRELALDRGDARGETQLVDLQRRHGAHARQPGGQQRLPVVGDMVAQARDDEDGGGYFVHRHRRVLPQAQKVRSPTMPARSILRWHGG